MGTLIPGLPLSMGGSSKGARVAIATIGAAACMLAGTASAEAAQVTGGPIPNTYLNGTVTMPRGGTLSFFNLDLVAPHNVASVKTKRRRNGQVKRIFESDIVGALTETPVRGVSKLRSGSYPFLCTIHPFMRGTLRVN